MSILLFYSVPLAMVALLVTIYIVVMKDKMSARNYFIFLLGILILSAIAVLQPPPSSHDTPLPTSPPVENGD